MAELKIGSIAELRKGLDAKEFSSLEVATQALALAARYKHLNAFITLNEQAILSCAAEADRALTIDGASRTRPLLGIPIAIKDMISVDNELTTCASKMLGNYRALYDATVVAKLKSAGAVIFGKTNMDEFAMGSSNENSAFGSVLNPWDTKRVPGGSSGGSAAAVAAGIVPGALGTDTGGSIRQPAAFCNLVGFKPTYGRVSRYGVVAFASSLDQVGPMASTVKDVAIMTEVIAGHDRHDSTSIDLPVPGYENNLRGDLSGLRIGVPKEYFVSGLNTEVESVVRAAISKLEELGAEVVEISLPHTEAGVAAYYIVAPAEASSNLARYDGVRYGFRSSKSEDIKSLYKNSRAEGFGAEVKRRIMMGSYVLSAGYYDAYYTRAQKIRTLIAQDFNNAFTNACDAIVCPTAPTTAFKIGEKVSDPLAMYLNDVFTIPVNLAGLPALSMPCGFDSVGLPIGMQVIGKPFDEATILKIANNYELGQSWCSRRPELV